MNFSLPSLAQTWQLLGWTMIYFLAAGTIVLLITGALRVALRRANSGIHYATSLAGFAVLAVLPIAIAGYLASHASLPRQRGEAIDATYQRGELTTNLTTGTNLDFNAENAKSAKVAEEDSEFVTHEYAVNVDGIANQSLTLSREAERLADERAFAGDIDFASILNHSATYLPWLWCVGTPLTFLLLATGLVGAERLRSSCQLLNDGPVRTGCDQLRTTLKIGRQVGVAVCERIATPILIGIVKPLILLPPAALNGWTTAELEMVLVHELSHVRRWDNAVNLVQRIIESLLFFHPAVWIVSGWVRRDREDCCDAAVVLHTARPQAYAELLLALASSTPGLAASAALAQHPVASRVRRILKLEDEPMLVTRKGLMFGVGVILAAVLLTITLPANESFSREAERVADERASTEETTNDANDTKEDLNAEGAKGAEKTKVIKADIPDTVQGDAAHQRIIKAIESLGYKARISKAMRGDGSRVDKLWITIPTDSNARVVWEEHSDGMRPRVVFSEGQDKPSVLSPPELPDIGATYPTNDTNEASRKRERLEEEPHPLFPTLEEQRAADLAYKLLDLELEKLGKEDLARVKARGYTGGLLVTSRDNRQGNLAMGDILVGLHIWPTQSLEQVVKLLQRDDLDQLVPLKFYVIRKVYGGESQFSGDASGEDQVVTGRIQVDLDAWRAMRETTRTQSQKTWALRTAEKKLELAHRKYQQALAAIHRVPGSIPEIEVEQLKGAMELAQLEVERLTQGIEAHRGEPVPTQAIPGVTPQEIIEPHDPGQGHAKSGTYGALSEALLEEAFAIRQQIKAIESQLPSLSGPQRAAGEQALEKLSKSRAQLLDRLKQAQAPAAGHAATDPAPASIDPDRYAVEASRESLQNKIDRLKAQLNQLEGNELKEAEEELAKSQHQMTELLREAQRQQRLAYESEKGQGQLLYDGKTFDEWRNLWKTELKTEKRIECIKALAAFGRAGKGQEAAEAILDVAAEYDFDTVREANNPLHQLLSSIQSVFVGVEAIPADESLPVLIERLEKDPKKWAVFARQVLDDIRADSAAVTNLLKQVAENPDVPIEVTGAALAGLAVQPNIAEDEETIAMIRDALLGEDIQQSLRIVNSLRFNRLDLFPEQVNLLLNEDEKIRGQAFSRIETLATMAQILDALLEIVSDPDRKEDHAVGVSALDYMSDWFDDDREIEKRRNEGLVRLGQALVDGDPEMLPVTIAAISALADITEEQVIEKLGDKISDERRKVLEQAIDEAQQLKSTEGGYGGMGGGARGGGGMF